MTQSQRQRYAGMTTTELQAEIIQLQRSIEDYNFELHYRFKSFHRELTIRERLFNLSEKLRTCRMLLHKAQHLEAKGLTPAKG